MFDKPPPAIRDYTWAMVTARERFQNPRSRRWLSKRGEEGVTLCAMGRNDSGRPGGVCP